MSGDRFEHDPTDGPTGTERRLTEAMASFAGGVRPEPGGWARIDDRLGECRGRSAGPGSPARRPVLVAAALLLVVALTAAVVVGARSGGDEAELVTAPATVEGEELAIVAVVDGPRLVVLGLDGQERRELLRPTGGEILWGDLAVSPEDAVVYVTRSRTSWACTEGVGEGAPEIVAVPLDGGAPRVVVANAMRPTVDATTGRLAYLTTPSGNTCPNNLRSAIGILDPTTGVSERVYLHPTDEEPASGGATPVAVDLPSFGIGAVFWSASGDSVWVHAASDATVRTRALIRLPVDPAVPSFGPAEVAASLADDGTDNLALMSSFDAWSSTPDGDTFAAVGTADALQGPGLPVEVRRVAFDHPVGDPYTTYAGSELVATITPEADGRLFPGDVDVDAATGDLLVRATPFSLEEQLAAPQEPDEEVDVVYVTGTHLYLVSGGSARLVATTVVGAAWIRVPRTEPPAPVPTSSTDVPAPPLETTTLPGTSVPPVPGTDPEGPPAAGDPDAEPRTGPEAEVEQAYRDFFEQGDRSALEGSGVLEPALQEGSRTVPDGGKGVVVVFDDVTVTGPTTATVDFRLYQGTSEVTAPTSGSAVFVDGRWKVSAATMCTLIGRVGIACPSS
jgi:hypothetical protein